MLKMGKETGTKIKFEGNLEYYITNGVLICTRNESTFNPLSPPSQRASSIQPGPKPGPKARWEALELTLVDHIQECHAQRIAMTRVRVIHKEIENYR
jgi:hypothetical protein